MTRLRRVGRWMLAGVVVAWIVWQATEILQGTPGTHNVPFDAWYGDWPEVWLVTGVFLAFLLGFARPRRRAEWGRTGLYSAFLVSLFAEMFGAPLTIYLLAPALGLPASAFGMNESHLWAYAVARLGLVSLDQAVYAVMVYSVVLIAGGMSLVALGWVTVYAGRGERLVTEGIYRWLRHPQYLGLILIIVGFNLMWPTLPTLLMAPVLIVMYLRLARREDAELAARFGDAFRDYAAETPGFVPWGRGRLIGPMPEPGRGQRGAETAEVLGERREA